MQCHRPDCFSGAAQKGLKRPFHGTSWNLGLCFCSSWQPVEFKCLLSCMQHWSQPTIILYSGIIAAPFIKSIIWALRIHTWLLAAAPMDRFRAPKDTHALKPEIKFVNCSINNEALYFWSASNKVRLLTIGILMYGLLYLLLSPDLLGSCGSKCSVQRIRAFWQPRFGLLQANAHSHLQQNDFRFLSFTIPPFYYRCDVKGFIVLRRFQKSA